MIFPGSWALAQSQSPTHAGLDWLFAVHMPASRWVSHPGRKMLEGAEPSSDVFTHCPLKEGTREGTTPQQLEVDLGKERPGPFTG